MTEFVITFREALEAVLIVGIVFTFLTKAKLPQLKVHAWMGVGAAILASVGVGIGLYLIGEAIGTEAYAKLFEAVMMFIAAGFLLWMIVWMAQRKNIAGELKADMEKAVATSGTAIFALVFVAILREGFETSLFLYALATQGAGISWMGAFGGVAVSVALGYAMFQGGKKIPLKQFFNISSAFLIVVAAGMVAYGTHEAGEFAEALQGSEEHQHAEGHAEHPEGESSVFLMAHAFEVFQPKASQGGSSFWYREDNGTYRHILHDKGAVGQYIKQLFGYNSEPTVLELVLWLVTLMGGWVLWRRAGAS